MRKKRIKGNNAVDGAARYIQPPADIVLQFDGQIAENFLALLEHRYQAAGSAPVAVDDAVNPLQIIVSQIRQQRLYLACSFH